MLLIMWDDKEVFDTVWTIVALAQFLYTLHRGRKHHISGYISSNVTRHQRHLVLRKNVVSVETCTVSGIYWIRYKEHLDLLLSTDPDESV